MKPGLVLRGAMALGGALWAVFGYYRFLTPYGQDVLWREDLGYSLILSNQLFVLYNLPGVLALLMTTLAFLYYVAGLDRLNRKLKPTPAVLLIVAGLFALLATVGLLVPFDAFTTGGLSFGALFLGLGVFFAGLAAALGGQGATRRWTAFGLMLLGCAGLLTVAVRPLVYALQLLPLAFGAAACALFGLGWLLLGLASPLAGRADWGRPGTLQEGEGSQRRDGATGVPGSGTGTAAGPGGTG